MAIKSFEIVSVPVSDQQRSKQFYRDVLGFDVLREDSMGQGNPAARRPDPDGNGWILRQPPA